MRKGRRGRLDFIFNNVTTHPPQAPPLVMSQTGHLQSSSYRNTGVGTQFKATGTKTAGPGWICSWNVLGPLQVEKGR